MNRRTGKRQPCCLIFRQHQPACLSDVPRWNQELEMTSSPFAAVPLAPKDPILGITEQYLADPRPDKVNLGVGVYYDEHGKLPLLDAVRKAEDGARRPPRDARLPADRRHRRLQQGGQNAAVRRRFAAVGRRKAADGAGARRHGRAQDRGRPAHGSPATGPSTSAIRAGKTIARCSKRAGFAVHQYAYYDPATHAVKFDEMLQGLEAAPAGSIIVLHAVLPQPHRGRPDRRPVATRCSA